MKLAFQLQVVYSLATDPGHYHEMYSRVKNHLRLLPLALLLIGTPLTGLAQKVGNEGTGAQLRAAAEMLERGEVSLAEAALRKIIAAEPRNADARTLAGVAADRLGKTAEAEKQFAEAARLQPDSPSARNNYGAILVRLGRTRQAESEFVASLALNPDQPSALVNLAQIRFRLGTPESLASAQSLFEKALLLAPDADVARAAVAVALRLGDKERATKAYSVYSQQSAAAVSAASRLELGRALLAGGLAAEAVAELKAGLASEPSNPEIIVALGRAYLARKDLREAGRTLESAVAAGLTDAKIYAALADVYEAAGYPENAIPAMRLAIEKDPKNEVYRARYGMLLVDTKAPAAAIIRLKESLAEFPNSARILLALGIAQQIDGKPLDAQASFEKALAIEPGSIPLMAYLALIYDEKGEFAQTAAMTEKALAIEEANPVLHYLLADTILKMPASDTDKAEKHLKRAIAIDPALTQAHLALGRLYARAGKWTEAADEFGDAVRLAPDLADAQYQYGRALARLKRTEESNAAFDRFKKLNETQTAQRETTRRDLVRRLANTGF